MADDKNKSAAAKPSEQDDETERWPMHRPTTSEIGRIVAQGGIKQDDIREIDDMREVLEQDSQLIPEPIRAITSINASGKAIKVCYCALNAKNYSSSPFFVKYFARPVHRFMPAYKHLAASVHFDEEGIARNGDLVICVMPRKNADMETKRVLQRWATRSRTAESQRTVNPASGDYSEMRVNHPADTQAYKEGRGVGVASAV